MGVTQKSPYAIHNNKSLKKFKTKQMKVRFAISISNQRRKLFLPEAKGATTGFNG